MPLFNEIRKISWDYEVLHTLGDFNTRTINQGLGFETKNDLRRTDSVIVTVECIPPFNSVKEKNNWFLENFSLVKMESEMYIRDFIKRTMPSSFEDAIMVTSMEILIDDQITKFSLEKVAMKLDVLEIQFDKNKDKERKVWKG